MAFIYGGIFVLSLALVPFYFSLLHKKEKEPWLCTLFVSISIVNLGYLLISVSKTVEFALFANKVAYLGQVIIPLCMYMLISKLCRIKTPKWTLGVLIGLAVGLLAIVCTTGYTDWYYISASLAYESGAAYLVKVYGVLHPCNLIYVLTYFVAMFTVIGVSFRKNRGGDQKIAAFFLVVVLGNVGMWIVEKLISTSFEFLSISYLMSEFAFFFVCLALHDYVPAQDVPAPVVVEERASVIFVDSKERANKIERILSGLPEETTLSARQMDVLEGILDGKSRKEIAADLHLSENTVKMHTSLLFKALKVTSRKEIFALLDGESVTATVE